MRHVRDVKNVFEMATGIYVISAFGKVKVGTSVEPLSRARDIGGQLIYAVDVPSDAASRIESYIHHALVKWSLSKEWFSCDAERAVSAVNTAIDKFQKGLPIEVPAISSRERQKRGLIAHAQNRVNITAGKLKIAIPLWFDQTLSVAEISRRSGLSTRTLYDHLPPRYPARDNRK